MNIKGAFNTANKTAYSTVPPTADASSTSGGGAPTAAPAAFDFAFYTTFWSLQVPLLPSWNCSLVIGVHLPSFWSPARGAVVVRCGVWGSGVCGLVVCSNPSCFLPVAVCVCPLQEFCSNPPSASTKWGACSEALKAVLAAFAAQPLADGGVADSAAVAGDLGSFNVKYLTSPNLLGLEVSPSHCEVPAQPDTTFSPRQVPAQP